MGLPPNAVQHFAKQHVAAMGSEAANVHLGRERQAKNILKDLRRRKANWLRSAAKDMAKAMEREWKEYANT